METNTHLNGTSNMCNGKEKDGGGGGKEQTISKEEHKEQSEVIQVIQEAPTRLVSDIISRQINI
jgi:hypothetical protein